MVYFWLVGLIKDGRKELAFKQSGSCKIALVRANEVWLKFYCSVRSSTFRNAYRSRAVISLRKKIIIILLVKRPWVETLEHIRSSCPLIHTHDPFKVKAYWLKSMYPQPYVPDIIRGQPTKQVVPHWSCCKHANSIEILEVVVFKPLPKIGFESIAKPSWAESI